MGKRVDYFFGRTHGVAVQVESICCGAGFDFIAGSKPDRREAKIVMGCQLCGLQYLFSMAMYEVHRPDEGETNTTGCCGTDAGYTRHIRSNTVACGPCKEAHRRSHEDGIRRRRRQALKVVR